MNVRESVDYRELHDALKPLYTLLGLDMSAVYSEPGITIGLSQITFVVPVTVGSTDSNKRARGVRRPEKYPHPQASQRNHAEMAYVVTVDITGNGVDPWRDAQAEIRKVGDRLEDIVHAFDPHGTVDALNAAAKGGRR